MYRKIKASDYSSVKRYVQKHDSETVYFKKILESWLNEEEASLMSRFYGFYQDGVLGALVCMTLSQAMLVHISDENALKSIDLLRLINHYQPKFVKGNRTSVKAIQGILKKGTSVEIKVLSELMKWQGSDSLKRKPIPDAYEIVSDLKSFSSQAFHDNKSFFMNIEEVFDRQGLSINQLENQVLLRLGQANMVGVTYDKHWVAQAIIEEEGRAYVILGGVFTVPSHRKKGLGEWVTTYLTSEMLAKDKEVYLFVNEKQEVAKRIYEKIGYECIEHYMTVKLND